MCVVCLLGCWCVSFCLHERFCSDAAAAVCLMCLILVLLLLLLSGYDVPAAALLRHVWLARLRGAADTPYARDTCMVSCTTPTPPPRSLQELVTFSSRRCIINRTPPCELCVYSQDVSAPYVCLCGFSPFASYLLQKFPTNNSKYSYLHVMSSQKRPVGTDGVHTNTE